MTYPRIFSLVEDFDGRRGVITGIQAWGDEDSLSEENHGTITVLLDNGDEEHYVLHNWPSILTVKQEE